MKELFWSRYVPPGLVDRLGPEVSRSGMFSMGRYLTRTFTTSGAG